MSPAVLRCFEVQPVALGESVMSVLSVSASQEAKSVSEVLLSDLRAAGITPTVTADGSGVVVPTDTLTPELRARITQNKTALIRLLIEAANDAHHHPELAPPTARAASANDPQGFDPGESALMLLAMRFADHIKASPQAREDWRRDVLETPQHLRQGLGEYLRQQLRQPHLLWRNQK